MTYFSKHVMYITSFDSHDIRIIISTFQMIEVVTQGATEIRLKLGFIDFLTLNSIHFTIFSPINNVKFYNVIVIILIRRCLSTNLPPKYFIFLQKKLCFTPKHMWEFMIFISLSEGKNCSSFSF